MYNVIKSITVAATLLLSNHTFCQDTSSYLQKHHREVVLSPATQDSSPILIEAFDSNRVFLLGELHGLKGNYELQFFMLRHLYKHAGVRTWVVEFPLSYESDLNGFVTEGKGRDVIKHDFRKSISYFSMLDSVYHFNQTVNEKIIIKTVDTEGYYNHTIRELYRLLPEQAPPAEIRKTIERLSYMHGEIIYPQLDTWFRKYAKKLHKDLATYPEAYKNYLGANYDKFRRLTNGFYVGITDKLLSNDTLVLHKREQVMYENFKVLMEETDGKVFAQFGTFHVCLQANIKWRYKRQTFTSMAARLNTFTDSPVKGKICSIVIEYPNIDYDLSVIPKESKGRFLELSKGDFTLFRLNAEGTPFKDLSKKCQYIIINKAETGGH